MMHMQPVTLENWQKLVDLFEANGNTNYCWCMTWRMSASNFRSCSSGDRKKELQQRVQKEIPVGVLGFMEGNPVAWCSIAPRETYSRLERSRTIKPLPDTHIWSIVCLFLSRELRQKGYTEKLLKGAIEYARSEGAAAVEAYPIEPREDKKGKLNYNVSYRFMGYTSTFEKVGFKDVTPPGSSRTVMRFEL